MAGAGPLPSSRFAAGPRLRSCGCRRLLTGVSLPFPAGEATGVFAESRAHREAHTSIDSCRAFTLWNRALSLDTPILADPWCGSSSMQRGVPHPWHA